MTSRITYTQEDEDRLRTECEKTNRSFDKINADLFNDAGNRASGLSLEEIGEDGHAVANKLWKISAYLRRRSQ